MYILRVPIGVIKEGFEGVKKFYKFKRENSELFVFLETCNILRQRFKLLLQGYVFTQEQLNEGIQKGNLFYKSINELHGNLTFKPKMEDEN